MIFLPSPSDVPELWSTDLAQGRAHVPELEKAHPDLVHSLLPLFDPPALDLRAQLQSLTDPAQLRFALAAAATLGPIEAVIDLLERPDAETLFSEKDIALGFHQAIFSQNMPAVAALYSKMDVASFVDELSNQGQRWRIMDQVVSVGIHLGQPEVAQSWLDVMPNAFPLARHAQIVKAARDRDARARLEAPPPGEGVSRRRVRVRA